MRFVFYKQLNVMDCGPTCLRMVAKYFGRHYTAEGLRQAAGFTREGVSMLGLADAAVKIGLKAEGGKITYDRLVKSPLPCILHWQQYHFVVFIPNRRRHKNKVRVADPGKGVIEYNKSEFLTYWATKNDYDKGQAGVVLTLEPTAAFYEKSGEEENRRGWRSITGYLKNTHTHITKVLLAMVITMVLQTIFPFFTQAIVDKGIKNSNIHFIYLVLLAQLLLVLGKTVVEFLRARWLLKLSNQVNFKILTAFWLKLIRLPLHYFDSHRTGDTLQRISDNKQVQDFLTGNALTTLFSLLTVIVYAIVLATYNIQFLLIFMAACVIYLFWIRLFFKIRRRLNYKNFEIQSKENSVTIQLVQGMQDIRLNNAEHIKAAEWQYLQKTIYRLKFKSLVFNQLQQSGGMLINQLKDGFLTFLSASLVIEHKITLGTMLALQYILGQLSAPVEQFANFTQVAQDARMSTERLDEVHAMEDEEPAENKYLYSLPANRSISFSNISFAYPGADNLPVINNISLEIPAGKVTAIIGLSGSGKTTLLKLLLRYYEQYSGCLKIGGVDFRFLSPSFWRSQCGAVLQDSFIFDDTIAKNIAVNEASPDRQQLMDACKRANILSFIEALPNGFNTALGSEGKGLSQGQKQRLLIARAIYKNPPFLFLDEATNSLDANNEKEIALNLQAFFENRTVVVVAHRLSTVRNADNIIVLHNGGIAEQGTHAELIRLKQQYFDLVKNQLELNI